MALAPKSAAVFVLDCSASMNRTVEFPDGTRRTALRVLKEYVKAKIVQRIMRDLKTLPVSVLVFGYHKTKNLLTSRAKDVARDHGEPFDRANDAYQGVYELVPFTFDLDPAATLERIDDAEAGLGSDGDAHTALIAAIETLDAQGAVAKYPTKEIFVLTDGESVSDWDGSKATVRALEDKGMVVKVVGVNFDDEYLGYKEEDKSDVKRENEARFDKLVARLGPPSVVANAVAAVEAVAAPQVRVTTSRADRTTLRLGDPDRHPDRSVVVHVEVKKAVVPAAIPSMKKMSLAGFDRVHHATSHDDASQVATGRRRGGGTKRRHDDDAVDAADEEQGSTGTSTSRAEAAERFNREERAKTLGNVGANYESTLRAAGLQEPDDVDADLASHDVATERRYFYRPPVDPANVSSTVRVKHKTILGGDSDEERVVGQGGRGRGRGRGDDDAERREIGEDAELQDAYFYGGDLVPFGDYDESFGKLGGLKQGIEVISFMKTSDVRYDWRMGDAFYVYASVGQSGSERLFSAFVNGMEERKTCAVVRFVKKGFHSTKLGAVVMPDPQVGILFPATDAETQSEFCYYLRLPFGEDVRSPGFASLSHLFNRKGQRIETHALLPTKAQDDAMDAFVDAMNLDSLAEVDENGDKLPWFNVRESYSPAIHNVQNTLMFRLGNPDGDLPPVPAALTRYLDPPRELVDRAAGAKQTAVDAFKVLAVPPKPKKTTKANENYAQPEEDDRAFAALLGVGGAGGDGAHGGGGAKAPRVSQVTIGAAGIELRDSQPSQPVAPLATAPADDAAEMDEEEPATEDEDEDGDAGGTPATSLLSTSAMATGRGESIDELVDRARRSIETSFSTQNFDKATSALADARNQAIQRDAPGTYNAALRLFAKHVHAHNHRDFLARIEAHDLGLVVGHGTTAHDAEDFLEALRS
ncbi:hypothetical protein JCM11491_003548 [Sporobolomyces phaffii]